MRRVHILDALDVLRSDGYGTYVVFKRVDSQFGRAGRGCIYRRIKSHYCDLRMNYCIYKLFRSKRAAFEQECRWWHKYGRDGDGYNHPGGPWPCPGC